MATCRRCKQDISASCGCTANEIEFEDGVKLPAIPYGKEKPDWGATKKRLCHDCNAPPGGYHHLNCDVERCPRCKGQLISCGCEIL